MAAFSDAAWDGNEGRFTIEQYVAVVWTAHHARTVAAFIASMSS